MAMHHDMAIEFTCDPEVDFVRGMIPHHDGAIKMCQIVRNAVQSNTVGSHEGMSGMAGHDMHGRRMMASMTMSPPSASPASMHSTMGAMSSGESGG